MTFSSKIANQNECLYQYILVCTLLNKLLWVMGLTTTLVTTHADGPRTIGQKLSQELQIYQQNSTNAKRVKKSRNLQQIINKKLTKTKTDEDYVGSATPPHNHRQGKRSPDTPVTKRPATE